MLGSETSYRRKTGENKNTPATSQVDTVNYIRQMAVELQTMSQKSKLRTLSYFLSMVVLEANEISGQMSRSEKLS